MSTIGENPADVSPSVAATLLNPPAFQATVPNPTPPASLLFRLVTRKAGDTPSPTITIYQTGAVSPVPDDWQRYEFEVDTIPVSYYVFRAHDERGVLVGHTGLKSDMPIEPAQIRKMNEAGISVIMMVTPNMGRNLNFMRFLNHVHERFTFDPESPVHTMFHKALPKFLYDHSTSGQFTINYLTSPRYKEKVKDNYTLSVCEAPFLDTASASSYDGLLIRTAFNLYARIYRDKLPRETLCGLYYLNHEHYKEGGESNLPEASEIKKIPVNAVYKLKIAAMTVRDLYGKPDKEKTAKPWYLQGSEYRTPTYGQIVEDVAHGRVLSKRLEKESRRKPIEPAIPLHVAYAANDCFSSVKTIEQGLAAAVNAQFLRTEIGQHNPISHDPKILKAVLDLIKPHLLPKPLDKTIEDLEKQKPSTKKWAFASGEGLGSRLSSAYQRVTSNLNTFTRFF